MSVIVHCEVPAADFALGETLRTVPDTTVVGEQTIACSTTVPLPLIWVQTPDRPAFEAALADDPTVAAYTQRGDAGTAALYRMEWTQRVGLVVEMLTSADGIICDAAGSAAGWQLRIYYSDRETLRTTYEVCDDRAVSLDIHTIRTLDGDTPQYGVGGDLTPEQYEALAHAYERGYFNVPRDADLDTVAADLGISHQALSERLRRAHHVLIKDALETPLLLDNETAQEPRPLAAETPDGEPLDD